MTSAHSFIIGFHLAHARRIQRELSTREIEQYFKKVDPVAFHNGIIDALAKDSFRYNLAKQIHQSERSEKRS